MRTGTRGELRAFERLIPASGSVDDFVDAVARHRGRPIKLLPVPSMPNMPSGLWLSVENSDYIAYPQDAAPTHRATIICHEVAHMALGHQPSQEEAKLAMARLVAPSISPEVATRILARHCHDTQDELDAERLATRLMAQLASNAARAQMGPLFGRLH